VRRTARRRSRQGELFPRCGESLRIAGLFAGIGGIERGLHQAGHKTEFLCEWDDPAQRVLRAHFDVSLVGDVCDLKARDVPPVDVLAGGFPCQDLSQAGRTEGIDGEKSGLVRQMFRLMRTMRPKPKWILVENVPFMLQLERGHAMRFLTDSLSDMGYTWAYRIVDTRAFGLPQRRRRVVLLASKTEDPRTVLFADEEGERSFEDVLGKTAYGFYWTEGVRGLGWGIDAIPTFKGGSTVGIPSPPAIWMPNGDIVTPAIRDAERLQGFPADWTKHSVDDKKKRNGPRWKLVGNAVSVPLAHWVGRRLARPGVPILGRNREIVDDRWPIAAWGRKGRAFSVPDISPWPVRYKYKSLASFLIDEPKLLSHRATVGFRKRTQKGSLRFRPEFLDALDEHIERMAELEGQGPRRRAASA